jgi:hypothetical protein
MRPPEKKTFSPFFYFTMSDGIDKLRFLNRDLANEVVAAAGTPTYAYDMAILKQQAENALAFRESHLARPCMLARRPRKLDADKEAASLAKNFEKMVYAIHVLTKFEPSHPRTLGGSKDLLRILLRIHRSPDKIHQPMLGYILRVS